MPLRNPFSVVKLALALTGVILPLALAQEQPTISSSKSTPDHWAEPGWWPTKGTSTHNEYAGTAACAKCHTGIVDTQAITPMFHAASPPSEADILKQHPELHFSDDRYDYLLSHHPNETIQAVKARSESATAPVGWAFGVGEVAQTYIFKRKGLFLESRLSYYTELQALGITTGHNAEAPETLEAAIGDPVDPEVTRRCFGCHTTASTVAGVFDPEHATLGVTCEACHGPGAKHVSTMTASATAPATKTTSSRDRPMLATNILNPKRMSPVESVDYCGACHRTPVDVAVFVQAELGVAAVRFQPYRLERSICWGTQGDTRITCVACHDPHKRLVKGTASYDKNCLQCHANSLPASTQTEKAAEAAPACKVATKDCASCHMPKVVVSATHATFTDHFIRIVRPGSGFRQ